MLDAVFMRKWVTTAGGLCAEKQIFHSHIGWDTYSLILLFFYFFLVSTWTIYPGATAIRRGNCAEPPFEHNVFCTVTFKFNIVSVFLWTLVIVIISLYVSLELAYYWETDLNILFLYNLNHWFMFLT